MIRDLYVVELRKLGVGRKLHSDDDIYTIPGHIWSFVRTRTGELRLRSGPEGQEGWGPSVLTGR